MKWTSSSSSAISRGQSINSFIYCHHQLVTWRRRRRRRGKWWKLVEWASEWKHQWKYYRGHPQTPEEDTLGTRICRWIIKGCYVCDSRVMGKAIHGHSPRKLSVNFYRQTSQMWSMLSIFLSLYITYFSYSFSIHILIKFIDTQIQKIYSKINLTIVILNIYEKYSKKGQICFQNESWKINY